MKHLVFIALFMLLATEAKLFAQGTPVIKTEAEKLRANQKIEEVPDSLFGWKVFGFSSFNFSQVSLNNWAAGGQGNISVLGTVNLNANLRRKKYNLDNVLNLNYGVIKAEGAPLEKSNDRIELISKFGYKAFGNNFFYTGLLSFRTQFNVTFDKSGTQISNFMAPAFTQLALGLSYRKNDNFQILLSPVSGKFTYVGLQRLADSGAYGVQRAVIDPVTFQIITPGQRLRPEVGAYLFMTARVKLMENITASTRLDLFNNYSDANKPNRRNIDVNWETLVTMKVNKYIVASFFTHLIYDQDVPVQLNIEDRPGAVGPRTQFKQILGVGLSYKFEK